MYAFRFVENHICAKVGRAKMSGNFKKNISLRSEYEQQDVDDEDKTMKVSGEGKADGRNEDEDKCQAGRGKELMAEETHELTKWDVYWNSDADKRFFSKHFRMWPI